MYSYRHTQQRVVTIEGSGIGNEGGGGGGGSTGTAAGGGGTGGTGFGVSRN